jgi:beta-N-acetylhexosaminidase
MALLLACAGVAWPAAQPVQPAASAAQMALPAAPDKAGEKWVEETLKKMTLDDKIGQLIVPALDSTYLASDTDEFDKLAAKITQLHVGGFHVFGGSERAPGVLLDPNYGTVILGQPLEAASLLNRLQALSPLPLLNTADFEAGVGFRIAGATLFPRQMAVGAAGDEQLAFEAAQLTAVEARAIGVHVNFSPIADVNNNPRNPVINIRSFAEALSRTRRHRRRFAPGPADHHAAPRTA